MRELSLLADGKPVLLSDLTREEVQSIYDLYKNAHDVLHRKESLKYYPGLSVSFHARGQVLTGVITKVNQKTVSIKVDGGTWRVSPTFIID